jgi:alpha-1,3-glucan synthase
VTADFVAKLCGLDAKNSQNELSIEKFLTKSEEAFFDKVKEEKRGTAASLRSQRDSFYHSGASQSSFFLGRPNCKCIFLSTTPSYSSFVSAPSFGDEMGLVGGGGDSGGTRITIPSRPQVLLSRELFGWPLYGIILAFGQVCRLSVVRSRLW